MVGHLTSTGTASHAQRRRSSIIIIVPGEELEASQVCANGIAHLKDHTTFESFKAKPRLPSPEISGQTYEVQRETGLSHDVGAMAPHIHGSGSVDAMNEISMQHIPRSVTQDPMFSRRVSSRVMPGITSFTAQQLQAHPSLHGPPNHLEDTPRVDRTSSLNAFSGQMMNSSHGIYTHLHPPTPNTAAAANASRNNQTARMADSTDHNGSVPPPLHQVPRATTQEIPAHAQHTVTRSTPEGMKRSENYKHSGRTHGMDTSQAVSSVVPPFQDGAVRSGVSSSPSYVQDSQGPSASPSRPKTLSAVDSRWAARTSNYVSLSSGVKDCHSCDDRGSMHPSPPSSVSVQSQTDHADSSLLNVDRHLEQQPEAGKCEKKVKVKAGDANPLRKAASPPLPISNGKHDRRHAVGNTSGILDSSRASVSFNGADLASLIGLSSARRTHAPKHQISKASFPVFSMSFSVPLAADNPTEAENDDVLASPLASLSLDGLLYADKTTCDDTGEGEKYLGTSSLSAILENTQSSISFSVLCEPSASPPPVGRQPMKCVQPIHLSRSSGIAQEAADRNSHDVRDVSASNLGLLEEESDNASSKVRLPVWTTTLAPPSASLSQLSLGRVRPHHGVDNTVHDSPAGDEHRRALWKENEFSFSSQKLCCVMPRASVGLQAGKAETCDRRGSDTTSTLDELGNDAVARNTSTTSNLKRGGREEDASTLQPHKTASHTSSPGPSSSQYNPPSRRASTASLVAAINMEKHMVTQSVSGDGDFSFSDVPVESEKKIVAAMGNGTHERKSQPCTAEGQAPPSLGVPPPRHQRNSASPAQRDNGTIDSTVVEKTLAEKKESGATNISGAPKSRDPGAAAPTGTNLSFSNFFFKSPVTTANEKWSVASVKSPQMSKRLERGCCRNSVTNSRVSATSPKTYHLTRNERGDQVLSEPRTTPTLPPAFQRHNGVDYSLDSLLSTSFSFDTGNMYHSSDNNSR